VDGREGVRDLEFDDKVAVHKQVRLVDAHDLTSISDVDGVLLLHVMTDESKLNGERILITFSRTRHQQFATETRHRSRFGKVLLSNQSNIRVHPCSSVSPPLGGVTP